MNVAAFFRDGRVRSALAGSPPAQSSSVLQDFFVQFDYADCSPSELLALSDLAARCGDTEVARTALLRVIQSGKRLHLAYYKLGRLDLTAKDFESAAARFRAGTEADPDFAYNWVGAARALHGMGRPDQACHFAERFAGFAVRPHANNELTLLADLADHLFDAGERTRSLPLYELVLKFGGEKPRDVVRLAEAHMAQGAFLTARTILEPQEERAGLDAWGRRALAVCLTQTGDHDRAAQLAEAVMLEDTGNAGFAATYVDALARGGDIARIRDGLNRYATLLPSVGLAELRLRIRLADGDYPGAAEILLAQDFGAYERLYYLCFETAYAALGAGFTDLADALSERLAAVAPADIFVRLLRIDTFFRQQLWEQAGEILAAIPDEDNANPHVLLKRFEYACFTGDVAQADTLRLMLQSMRLPTKQFMLPIFRFMAERGKWDELLDGALRWIDGQFNYDQIGYVLFRAAKQTGRHMAMVGAVETVEGWQHRPDLVRLRANLLCDNARTLPELDHLARDPTAQGDESVAHKIAVKREVLLRAQSRRQRRAVFMCTDRNYLPATIAALHSLTRWVDRRNADMFIVLDDALVEQAQELTAPYGQAGYTVTIVPASQIVDSAEKLYASYGLFTSGHVLSSAAYYRIYFARHLASLGCYDRAVYMDSDVLVRSSLDPLFAADLQGKPMGARLETMRPEVRRAIKLHNLKDDRYFNSGVLVFDLKHERLSAGLDAAVASVMDDEVTLLFHDQCALNLGFRGDFADLDKVWNFPIGEATRAGDIPPNAGIVHFLDRPKPWSAAYGGDCAVMWMEHWRDTAAFIGEENAVELFDSIKE